VSELVAALTRWGVLLVGANVLLEQLGLPIPAFPTLVLAGALAAEGKLPFAGLLAISVAASLAADTVWFLLGRRHGHRILRTLCRISLSPDSCVRQTESIFDRWGLASLLVANVIPGFSTVAPPLAGSGRVELVPFLGFSAAGGALWAGSALLLGALFHGAVDGVLDLLSRLGSGALVLLAGAFVAFLAVKWEQRRRFFKELRMARIPPDQLRGLLAEGAGPLVFDVRSKGALERDPRRIPGAVIIDVERLDEHVLALPKEREIVLYCT
jgi:membrane protein DedA with SNARE-associated domain